LYGAVNLVFQGAGQANQRPLVTRRRAGHHEVDAQASSRADGRRLRRGSVDHGGGGEEATASRVRGRRRSMYVGVPSQTVVDGPTSHRRRSSRAPVTSDVSLPPAHGLSLYDQLRNARRSSCVPVIGERSIPCRQASSEVSVTGAATLRHNSATFADAPVRLQLQTKVKVSERPVRCLLTARCATEFTEDINVKH